MRKKNKSWTADAIGAMGQTIVANEGVVIVHDDGQTSVGDFVGGGFLNFSAFSGISDTLIGSISSGAATSNPQTKIQTAGGSYRAPSVTNNGNTNVATSIDPVNLFTGSALYDRGDITVGSSSYPYALTFSRSYASNLRLADGPLGLGWTHNLATKVSPGSNGLRATGEVSAKEAVGTIASAFIWLKLSLGISYPTFVDNLNVLITVVSMRWLVDELFTGNSISINDVSISRTFIKLVDGTYNPQPGSADTITVNMDGTITFQNPQKQTWNFNTDGTIHTYVDPAGVTVTWTYSSGKLTSVSNGLGRTLTLSYTGDRLSSVTDGNDRSVSFELDADKNLVAFTDTEDNTIGYQYAAPGLLSQIFLPANPTVAVMTNTYDSLNRVKTQSG